MKKRFFGVGISCFFAMVFSFITILYVAAPQCRVISRGPSHIEMAP